MRSPSSRDRMRLVLVILSVVLVRGTTVSLWCVARSEASEEELQKGLDYACQAGADCTPIQENGLCFLPNTLQAHASYAFNSFFQRSFMAPSSCDFSRTATLAKTDPSYGSCIYPASPSTAGGITSGVMPTRNPNIFGSSSPRTPGTSTSTSPATGVGFGGVFNPNNTNPPIITTTNSKASSNSMPFLITSTTLFLLVPSFCM